MEKRNVMKAGVAVVLLGVIFAAVFHIMSSKTPTDSVEEEGKASVVPADTQAQPTDIGKESQEETPSPEPVVKIKKHRDGKAL